MMRAYVTTVHDPFHPMRGREQRVVEASARIADLAPLTSKPFICLKNGNALLRRDWNQTVEDGEVITFVTLPQGRGRGGSNPLAIVAMIVVAIYAPYLANALGGSGFVAGTAGTFAATTAGHLVTAGIVMAGSALVNAMVAPPRPNSPQAAAALAAPSPTYSLQAQGNTARLDAAIPVQYGRMKFFPDFGAQPYAEFAGNEQFLYQLLVLGQGEFNIESINIENTPIASFSEITYEVIPPYGTLTLFPANVVTSGEVSGQEAAGQFTGTYSMSGTTTVSVAVTGHGLATGDLVYLDFTSGTGVDGAYTVTVSDADHYTVTASAADTTSGNVTQQQYIGPFVASASGTAANYLGIDIVLARGLYYYDSGTGALTNATVTFTVEAQEVDGSGTPVGSWAVLGSETLTAATTTPQRYSYRYAVTAGRYQVRLRRTNVKQTATGWGNDLNWAGLRAYLPDTRNFGNVTLIALRMKASNNLSLQASRKINVIATRQLYTWNPSTGWSASTTPTRSIAWALADICQAQYGGKLGDSRVDLQALYDLDATWTARGDTCDGRIDNSMTLWEALMQVATTGRAKPYMQGGIVRFARDEAETIPAALFSMRNIVPGSFKLDYVMPSENTADAVDVSYFSDASWAPQIVSAALSGSTSANPAKVNLFGVVQRDQAYREGLYQAACNRYRRKFIKFGTEMEGFIPSFGDLVAISHDMPQWGQYAEAVSWDAGTLTLTVSEPLTFGTGTHYVGLRKKGGGVSGPWVVTAGATAYELIFAATPDYTPYTGSDYERTHIVFGWGETWRQPARVVSVRPRGLYHVDIECVNEDANVHTADTGVTTPSASSSQLNTLYTAPVVAGLEGRSSPSDPTVMLISWQPAQGADYYIIEQSADGVEWTRSAETRAANWSGVALYGSATIIGISAVGFTRGPRVSLYYGGVSDYMWNAVITTLMWDTTTPPGDGSAVTMWRF